MRPLVTQALVADELAEVYLRLPNHAGMKARPRETCQAYFADLRDLSAESFRAACKRVRYEDNFFPKVSTLRRYAQEWTQRNPESSVLAARDGGIRCPNCGEEPTWLDRWRPIVDRRGAPVLSADGLHVMLEPYVRFLCRCAQASPYAPLAGVEPPQMPTPDFELRRFRATALTPG